MKRQSRTLDGDEIDVAPTPAHDLEANSTAPRANWRTGLALRVERKARLAFACYSNVRSLDQGTRSRKIAMVEGWRPGSGQDEASSKSLPRVTT